MKRVIVWVCLFLVSLLVCSLAVSARGEPVAPPGAVVSAVSAGVARDDVAQLITVAAGQDAAGVAASSPIAFIRYNPLAVVVGSPVPITLFIQTTSAVTALTADLENGDHLTATPVGGNAYQLTLTAAQVLYGYASGYNHSFYGFLNVQTGATLWGRLNLLANVSDSNVPPVPVSAPAADARVAPHIINLLMPSAAPGDPAPAIAKRFYQLFPDTFDFLNIISADSIVENRYHFGVSNNVHGIGISIFNNTAQYGSSGRLMGISNYPVNAFFDLAELGSQHEVGHQWINFVLPGEPHWPISDLARGVTGISIPGSNVGGSFPWDLIALGNGNYRVQAQQNAEFDVGFNDLDLYLMGLLPAAQVRSAIVFQNQNQSGQLYHGGILQGPVQMVNANTIIASQGLRQPSAATARKSFHLGSIIVSRDRLLNNDEMAFFDYMAARGEATKVLPYALGRVRGLTKPFFLATHGLGTWMTNLQKSPTLMQRRLFLPIQVNPASGETYESRAFAFVLDGWSGH